MQRGVESDRRFGAGARWHRVHRWLAAVATGAFVVVVGLAIWLGSHSAITAGTSTGLGGGLQVVLVRIPALALGFGDGGTTRVLAVARTCCALEVVGAATGAGAGLAWLRADRLRKPLNAGPAGRHRTGH
jgi:hypothetical protein